MRILKLIALIISLSVLMLGVYVISLVPKRLDPQGEAASSCIRDPIPEVASGKGMVVSGHYTYCDNFIHDSAAYIYVHGTGEPESSRSLVFRFSDDPSAGRAEIVWISPTQLQISVSTLDLVTKMISSYEGIAVDYRIGHERSSRDIWPQEQRHVRRIGMIASIITLVAGILCVGLCLALRKQPIVSETPR